MARRTLSLGSGLNPSKLADSIRQLEADDPPTGALACHAEDNEHAWVHLRFVSAAYDTPAHWHLTAGLPADIAQSAIITSEIGTQIILSTWNPGIEFVLRLPITVDPMTLAHYIIYLMTRLQQATEQQSIRLSIEYP